mgnify:CR=1 FL=1
MTTPYENFVNIALGKALSSDVTLPTADKIPVFTGIGRQVTGKTKAELGLALTADLGTAASADVGDFDTAGSASTAQINAQSYADGLITSVYKVQGSYNPQTTGNFPTSANTVGSIPIKQAFIWIVSGVFGQYTFQGVTVNNGDTIVALIDNPSATTSADWHITESNLGYTPENQNNKDTDGTLADNSDTKYPSQKAVKTYADTKQAALADVITANTYGSSTQYPVITFNAKGIATGVTLQTPTFTDATFSVQKNGSPSIAATWSLSALTESRVHTYPDKDIDFKTLSSVGASDSNTLSGTRNRIVGGSGNHVSGTDNVVIGCSDGTVASGSGRAVIILANKFNTSSTVALAPNSIVLGTSIYDPVQMFGSYWFAGAVQVQTALCIRPVTASGSTYSLTSDGEDPTYTNCLPALLYANTFMSARHEFDIIIVFGEDVPISPSRTFYAKRTVYVARRVTSEIPLNATPVLEMSIATPQPDVTLGLGSNTVTIGFTLDAAGNRLIPTVAATSDPSYQRMQVSCRVDSHYNRK